LNKKANMKFAHEYKVKKKKKQYWYIYICKKKFYNKMKNKTFHYFWVEVCQRNGLCCCGPVILNILFSILFEFNMGHHIGGVMVNMLASGKNKLHSMKWL
jgi:hypothetical protein